MRKIKAESIVPGKDQADLPVINLSAIALGQRNAPNLGVAGVMDELGVGHYRSSQHFFRGSGPDYSFSGTSFEDDSGYRQMGLWLDIGGNNMFVEVLDNMTRSAGYTGETGHGSPDFEIRLKRIHNETLKVMGFVGIRYYASDESWRLWDYAYTLEDDSASFPEILDRQRELELRGEQNRPLVAEDERLINGIFKGKIEGELPAYLKGTEEPQEVD